MTLETRHKRDGSNRRTAVPEFLNRGRPLSLRPHHFTYKNLDFVRTALRFPGNARVLAETLLDALEPLRRNPAMNDYTGYFADVMHRNEGDRQRALATYEKEFTAFGTVPDDFPIHFGLGRDGMCFALSIGAHCSATKYAATEYPHKSLDVVGLETIELDKVRQSLRNHGYQEGEDFVNEIKPYILYDYQGADLRAGSLIPVRVDFNTLVVKAGALRRIAREFD